MTKETEETKETDETKQQEQLSEESNTQIWEDSKEQLQENSKDKALTDMVALLKRTQASFENFRKQTDKRISEIQTSASKNMIIQILPVVDNFHLALKNAPQEKSDFLEGIELIYAQLNSLLEDNKVQIINTENQIFDPYFHEALMKIASEEPENTIIEEFQRGYTLHGNVIRHARVKLSAGKKQKNNTKIANSEMQRNETISSNSLLKSEMQRNKNISSTSSLNSEETRNGNISGPSSEKSEE
ncbi:nucleotide exchange factor GrpE [Candidatus Woesearchaeota archaeon CG10_big_fil_rev_8_21_14_0_10_32_24]|nr:MAG: nucleotide exchange factor GrpE [Candidatus Woesearchaeota archaeon CG10_big_fil_rev_8_21_14_0_10_32_24]